MIKPTLSPDSYLYRQIAMMTGALIAIISALYIPFLNNPLIFDDHNIFAYGRIYDSAAIVFNFSPRTFPNFTLAFTEVIWKNIESQRIASLLLHIINALIIFRLFTRWLADIAQIDGDRAINLGFIGSLLFAIHPAATYGAGYLAQRTIVFATMFSLLTLWFFWRSLSEKRISDSIAAAMFYALAVFSKEHAIMLPAVAMLLTKLSDTPWRMKLASLTLFLALCVPSALTVVLALKGVIGTPYEPDAAKFVGAFSSTTPSMSSVSQLWLLSVSTQAGCFFKYLQIWLAPFSTGMSIDIRLDFMSSWTPPLIAVNAIAFFCAGVFALTLLKRHRSFALSAFGLLYFWLLFMPEFASLRFQEPLVLYRSYLWAPGIMLVVVTILSRLSRNTSLTLALLVAPLFFFMAHDRLSSMSSELALWDDAVSKLPTNSIIGADRVFYNRGIQNIRAKRFHEAISDLSQSIGLNPSISSSFQQRGVSYYSINEHTKALADFNRAIEINEIDGRSHYGKGLALEALGRVDEARSAYQESIKHGSIIANLRF